MTRREMLTGLLPAGAALLGLKAKNKESLAYTASDLERRHGGRLGIGIYDTAQPKQLAYRGNERFPLCSTHKFLAAAFVLARVDRGKEHLTRRVIFSEKDLVPYSPITEKRVGGRGMTLGELCAAAMIVSDNTAANLLLESFGGPPALTAFLRSQGDQITRLDRREPELNNYTPGDLRDTTTPRAMLNNLHRFLLGTALTPDSRMQLATWLCDCKTGSARLRSGVPLSWRAGDKTGTGSDNATNDIAIFWPPQRAPLLVTAYYVGSSASLEKREAVLSQVGRQAAAL